MSPFLFQFEADFAQDLHCIPMVVRFKLDTCGIKLKLLQWQRFSPQQRQALADAACTTDLEIQAYRDHLLGLITEVTGDLASLFEPDPMPAWAVNDQIAPDVEQKAAALEIPFSLAQWAGLTPLQRFALIKLSRSSHEHRNFLPAVQEFGLWVENRS
jgi:hypothetical protein